MICYLYFTILVKVFTNHILAKTTYFTIIQSEQNTRVWYLNLQRSNELFSTAIISKTLSFIYSIVYHTFHLSKKGYST